MEIFYDDRPCGSGKTYSELLNAVQNRGLYLFAVDRREAMNERFKDIAELSLQLGKRPRTIGIQSGMELGHLERHRATVIISRSVRADVEALPALYESGHVIAFITHEALKTSDLAEFDGWHLVIDETPSVFDQQELSTTQSREFFSKHYRLDPIGAGKRAVIQSKSAATPADFRRDSLASAITVMHARVCSKRLTVITDITSWDELDQDRKWTWWSIWSPEQLAAFETVKILANAFTRSFTYHLFSKLWPNIEWVQSRRPSMLRYKPRPMLIRYFAERHTASRGLFNSDTGRDRLRQMAMAIAGYVDPGTHIWTCNDREQGLLKPLLANSVRLSPRQAGSNSYAQKTTVTAIYTAKATPSDRDLIRDLGIDPHVATETREYETIYQFVSRCSVRDPSNTTPIKVYVYDRQQALYLAQMFDATGYVDCSLELIDLGFAHDQWSSKPGPKPVLKGPDELAAAKEKQRKGARERKRRERSRASQRKQKPLALNKSTKSRQRSKM